MDISFDSELSRWQARDDTAWFFVAVPAELSEMVREIPRPPRGFGSVRVDASIGGSHWRTSIFPDAATRCYQLPIKRAVRDAEGIDAGDTVTVQLRIIDA